MDPKLCVGLIFQGVEQFYFVVSDGFSAVRTERPHRIPKECQKVPPYKQDISLFFHSSTMTMASVSVLFYNFKVNAGIKYSIESDNLFFVSLYFWDKNGGLDIK